MTPKPKAATKAKAKPKANAKPKSPAVAIGLGAVSADAVTMTGFGHAELHAAGDDALVVTCPVLQVTGLLALAGTPRLLPIAAEFAQHAARGRDGRLAVFLGLWQKTRFARVYADAALEAPRDLAPKQAREFAAVGFVGDRLVAIPGYLGHHRRSSVMFAAQPHVERAGALVPVTNPREDGGPTTTLSGVIACRDGRDVVVWGGRLFVLEGDTLVRAARFDLETFDNRPLTWAPRAGGGFYVVLRRALVEVTLDAAAPRVVLADREYGWVRPGPDDGTLLLGDGAAAYRYDVARGRATPLALGPGEAFYVPARRAFAILGDTAGAAAGIDVRFMPG